MKRVEQRLLVLLHVAIVRHRQAFHGDEQRGQISQRRGPICRGSARANPGFFFCGIRLDPLVTPSPSVIQLNSSLE